MVTLSRTARAKRVGIALAAGTPLPDPPQRVYLGMFSFLPPSGPGWIRTPEADEWSFNAAGPGAQPDESYAFLVYVAKLDPPFDGNDAALLEEARKEVTIEPNAPQSGRYLAKRADVVLWKRLETTCLRLEVDSIDRKPVRRSGSHAAMSLNAVTFLCVHPREPRTRIMLGFSHRSDEGHEDPLLGQKAESLAEKIEFRDAP